MIIKCPSCGQELECGEELQPGQHISCPICQQVFSFDGDASGEVAVENPPTEEPSAEVPVEEPQAVQPPVEESSAEAPAEEPQAVQPPTEEPSAEVPVEETQAVQPLTEAGGQETKATESEPEAQAKDEPKAEKSTQQEPETLRGKVYEDSISLYDDEARVAFDYFRKAAERIVGEEDAASAKKSKAEAEMVEAKKEVDAADAEYAAAQADAKKARLWFIGFFLIVPLVVGILKLGKAKKRRVAAEGLQAAAKEKVAGIEKTLADVKTEFANIKRDYTISKLGVAYVPIATEVPFEDKSFILDDTKKTADSTFDLYQVKAQNEFAETLSGIKKRESTVPVVETGKTPESIPAKDLVPSFDTVWMNDYLGSMDRDLRAMTYFLRDLEKTSVTLPVIAPQGDYAKFLDEYCTSDTGNMPVLNVFDNSSYADDLKKFEGINEMKKKMTFSNESLDDVLQNFISEIAANVQYVGRAKIASIGKVLSVCGETLLNTFKASYNHYSPDVAKDEIERLQQEDFSFRSNNTDGIKPFILSSGSRVRYDAVSSNWVADDGARVSAPLGIHQIQEEIIAPLVANLLRETRIERLKVYNNIIDQKLNYVKEWQKEVDDFYGRGRAEGNDIINQIQVVLGEFTTAYSQYQAFQQTERAVAGGDAAAAQNMKLAEGASEQTVISFKEQADQIDGQKEEFNRYVEALQEDIERRAGEFSYTEDYEATLRDRHSKEAVMSLKAIDKLDERRKVLLAANPYIAENAQLPPEATVNGEALYGRLGKDLRVTADALLNEIDTELKSEPVQEEADGAVSEEASEAKSDGDQADEEKAESSADAKAPEGDVKEDAAKAESPVAPTDATSDSKPAANQPAAVDAKDAESDDAEAPKDEESKSEKDKED